MPNLKPCPLCGSEDIERRVTASSAKIRCRKCGVGISRAYFGEYGSRAEAEKEIGVIVTKLWNRRAESGTAAPTVREEKFVWRWKYFHKQNIAVCPNCSFERDLDANFGKAISCPNCGAKMDGDGNG